MDYSPRGCKEADMTEVTEHTRTHMPAGTMASSQANLFHCC